jgi:hypothetical protein
MIIKSMHDALMLLRVFKPNCVNLKVPALFCDAKVGGPGPCLKPGRELRNVGGNIINA